MIGFFYFTAQFILSFLLAKVFDSTHKIPQLIAGFVVVNALFALCFGANLSTILILSLFWTMYATTYVVVLAKIGQDSIGRWTLVVFVFSFLFALLL